MDNGRERIFTMVAPQEKEREAFEGMRNLATELGLGFSMQTMTPGGEWFPVDKT